MKKIIAVLLLMNLVFACGTHEKKNAEEQRDTIAVKPEAVTRSVQSFMNDYNAFEQLFTNDNWLLADKKDSSYFYFSRLENFKVNTYEYKLINGDSAKVQRGTIQTEGDKITWFFNNQKLYLISAGNIKAAWSVDGSDSAAYEFMRLDNNFLRITYPGRKQVTMKKMLPFSLFLVRSRYDFANGTRYAFDTTQFNKKGR
jgi:hypothetical protein